MAVPDRILSLAHLTFVDLAPPALIRTAAAAGFSHVGLRLRPPSPEQPASPLLEDAAMRQEVRSALAETGIRVFDAEVARLLPGVDVASFAPLLETAAWLGAGHIVVSAEDPDRSALVASFAAFCELARPFGLVAALEFMPWTVVRSLADAAALVAAAGCGNGRILIDAIHLDRAGEGAADVAAVPRGVVAYVQLCDAPRERPTDLATLLHQARAARLTPGSGGLDLRGLLSALPRDLPLSLEVPMRERAASGPPAALAAELLAATRQLLRTIDPVEQRASAR
jgi:sugar phosphate isomerase/epimerase